MATTCIPALRPLNVGQLLDQSIRLYRRNFLKFVGIVAAVQIPLTLLQMALGWLTMGGPDSPLQSLLFYNPYGRSSLLYYALGGMALLAVVQFVLVRGVATAALTRAVSDHYLGQSRSFLGAYRMAGRSWLRLIGALLLAILLGIVLLLWMAVPCIGWFTGLGMLIYWVLVIVPVIAPIVVLEGQSVAGSIRRAWDLVRRRFWWVVGFVAILYLFNQLVVTGPSYLINLLLGELLRWGGPSMAYLTQVGIHELASMLLDLIFLPLQLTAVTLMYFDLRVRTEGFDLALLAESALGSWAEAADLVSQAPPPEGGWPLTWKEMGYFALITIGLGALCGGLYVILLILVGLIAGPFMLGGF